MRARIWSVLVASAAALATMPARGAWVRSPAAAQVTGDALRAVSMGSPTLAWAVGGGPGRPVIVRTADQFQSLGGAVRVTGLGASDALNAVWVQPGAATVHAFGAGGLRASYSAQSDSWTTSSPFGTGAAFDIAAVGFLDASLGYLLGTTPSTGNGALARWTPDSLAIPVALPLGTGPLLAGGWSAVDEGVFISANQVLVQHGAAPSPLFTLPGGGLAAASVRAGRALALGAGQVVVLAQTGSGWSAHAASGAFPIAQPTGLSLAPFGFAVAVGRGGAIAESLDGGETWRAIPPRSAADLLAVDCWDANACVAVGAAGEILWYRNTAPTAVVTNAAGSLDVVEGSSVCLMASVADLEGDAIRLLWSDEGAGLASKTGVPVDGDTTATPPCFVAPHVCGSQTFVLGLRVDDGRLQQTIQVPLVVREAPAQPPTGLSLSPAPPYDWALGQVQVVTARAATSCGRQIRYSFFADGALPQPTLSGGGDETATFDLHSPADCRGGPSGIRVVATDDRGISSPPLLVPVNVSATPFAPAPEARFSNGLANGETLRASEATEVTILPHHGCASSFSYAWSCLGETSPGNVQSHVFANPNTLCAPTQIACTVAVTPLLQPTSTVSFGLTYAARANSLDVDFSNPLVRNGSILGFNGSTAVTVTPHSACNPDPNLTWGVHWSCSGVPSPPDGQRTLSRIGNDVHLCRRTPVSCTITATPGDGSPPAEAKFTLVLAASPPVTLTSPTGDCATPRRSLARGQSFACTAQTCADATVTWLCTDGYLEQRTKVFTNDQPVCEDDAEDDCLVKVVSADGDENWASDVGVTLTGTYNLTTVGFTFSDGFENGGTVPVGGSVIVGVDAWSDCPWAYKYSWACMGAPEPGAPDPSCANCWKFTAPGPPYWNGCDTGPVACLVTATPQEDQNHNLNRMLNPVGQAAVYINFAPLPTVTTLRPVFTGGFQNGGMLNDGERTELDLYAGNPCATEYDWQWNCTSLSGALPQGAVWPFQHPGRQCTPIPPDVCQITATARGSHPDSATTSIEVNYQQLRVAPTASLEISGGKTNDEHLAAGEPVTVTVEASNSCGSPLDYFWECHGILPPAQGTRVWELPRPTPACVPGSFQCWVTVVALDGNGAAPVQTFRFYDDPSVIPIDLAVAFSVGHSSGDGIAPGETVKATVSTFNECNWDPGIEWDCEGVDQWGAEGPRAWFTNPRGRCVDAKMRCSVRARPPFGLPSRSESFEFTLLHEDAPAPDILPVDAASYVPAASFALDCERGQGVRLVPRFGVAGAPACPMTWNWSQKTALPLDYEVSPDGVLLVRARPGRDADLFGEKAQFELRARSANSPTVTQLYEVEFLPQQVVMLAHRSDRRVAGPGEEIGFALELRNRCETQFAPVDVRLSLEGLSLVPGSARLDGHLLAEGLAGQQLVFSQLGLPPAGQAAILAYRARASAVGVGPGRATALAVLSHRPDIAVSAEAASSAPLPVSCQCSSASDPALALWGWWLLALVPRRRR